MPTTVRLKLDCLPRALEFFVRHPDRSPVVERLLERVEALHARTRALLGAKLRAHGEAAAAVAARERAMVPLLTLLGQVRRLTRAVALHEGAAELRDGFRIGPITRDIPLARARRALDTATRYRELLDRYGMPPGMLARLREELGRYAEAEAQRAEAAATIVRANAELAATAAEGLLVIRHLDALTRIRFADNAERRAEWVEASAVRWEKKASRRRRASGDDGEGPREAAG